MSSEVTIEDLERKVEGMQGPIPLHEIDWEFKNPPEYLAEKYGHIWQTIHRVEGGVPFNVQQIKTLCRVLPDVVVKFLKEPWTQEELGHHAIAGELLRLLNVEPLPKENEEVDLLLSFGGLMSQFPKLRRPLTKVAFGRHTMHERQTGAVYGRQANLFKEDDEASLADMIIRKIMPQEGGHLDFSRSVVKWLDPQMSPAERVLARVINIVTYEGVGVGNDHHKAEMGRVALSLSGGDMQMFAAPVEEMAKRIFNDRHDDEAIIAATRRYALFFAGPVAKSVENLLGRTHETEFIVNKLGSYVVNAEAERTNLAA